MQQNFHSIRVSLLLAYKDLWHDKKITFCLIVSLASVVAPLLLLFGLKSGIINTMEDEFLNDPSKREIHIMGFKKRDLSWFEQINAHPEVAFLIPSTRILNAQVDFVKNKQQFMKTVEILPSSEGDPILAGHTDFPAAKHEVVVSHTVAQKLKVQKNDQLTMVISRKFQNGKQFGKFKVIVIGTLPESATSKDYVFVTLGLQVDVDDFRDEVAVTEFGITDGKKSIQRTTYSGARVFSKTLEGVAIVADLIRDTGYEVRTEAKAIEAIQQTEKLLTFIVKVIAWVAILGGAISLAGFLIANVDRKRQHLAMLRLLGFTATSIAIYPISQSLVIASFGFLIACGGYFLGANEFDQVLGGYMQGQGYICQLSNKQILGAYILTNLVVLTAALIGGLRAVQIEPAETFRQQ